MIVNVKGSEEENELSFLFFKCPRFKGAVVAIDPNSNQVLALVGEALLLIHTSTVLFKVRDNQVLPLRPFVYAAGIKYGLTPSSLLIDSPESLNAGDHSVHWKPRNYDGKYLGPITFRTSLEKSRNVTTIKLAKKIGVNALEASS